jgi:bifunctional DNA-binding transcriptional regulator/antitoxin component of YhaV-PrlF toxin-antitoxin module
MQWLIELMPYGEDAIALLPDELLATSGLKVGDELDWHVRKGRIILTRRNPPARDEGGS